MTRNLKCECGNTSFRVVYDYQKRSVGLACSICESSPPRIQHPDVEKFGENCGSVKMWAWPIKEKSDD